MLLINFSSFAVCDIQSCSAVKCVEVITRFYAFGNSPLVSSCCEAYICIHGTVFTLQCPFKTLGNIRFPLMGATGPGVIRLALETLILYCCVTLKMLSKFNFFFFFLSSRLSMPFFLE